VLKLRYALVVIAAGALCLGALAGCGEKAGSTDQTPATKAAKAGPGKTAPAAEAKPTGKPLAVGQPVPDFELTDVNGVKLTKADLAGKVIAVDFWATWCDSCTKKLVKYQPMYEKYQAQGLEFMVVSSDNTPETVKGWLKTDHPEFTMSFVMKSDATNNAFWGGPAKYEIPVLKIIDRKGVLRYDFGPSSTVEEAEAAFQTLLAEK
jgi:cytochrome c biogenesis protein CcmG, thiol:disulfide interchange protein DsbE